MEIWCPNMDVRAKYGTPSQRRRIVTLVHTNLGLASVVKVVDVVARQALRLETASGAIFVDHELTKVLSKTV